LPSAKPMHAKYFIAIVPEGTVFEKAEAIKQNLFNEYKLKGALRSPAHITLHRPFEWKEEKEDLLIDTLKNFKACAPFDIELCDFNCFEPRVIFIDVKSNPQLNELHKNLARYCQINLRLLNEINDPRGFHPHITLAFRDLKRSMFYPLWENFKEQQFKGIVNVTGFSLLKLENRWKVIKEFNI
jgi:2'-5' RNA ligase